MRNRLVFTLSCRPIVAIAVVGLVVWTAGQPVAASPRRPLEGKAALRIRTQTALARLAETRNTLSRGGLADAVWAAAGLAGVPLRPVPTAVSDFPQGTDVPEPLRNALTALVSAVETARSAAASSLLISPRALMTRLDATGSEGLREVLPSGAPVVDRSLLYSAAFHLAAAIDEALPALRWARAALQSETSGRVAGADPGSQCDVVGVLPLVCVGGEGSNTHEDFAILTVDLGGDDLYTTAAGGGTVGVSSLAIDLAGDDRYEAERTLTYDPVQGAGVFGAIGILVDEGGNDRYTVTGTGSTLNPETLAAQGFGTAGVGILADRSGDDVYRVVNSGPGGLRLRSLGHGAAEFGGMGLLLDDSGNDSYLLSAAPTGGITTDAQVQGAGSGVLGAVGLFRDGSGDDRMTLEAVAPPLPPDDGRQNEDHAQQYPPDANVMGAGFGANDGAGLALTGPGAGAWSTSARISSPQAGEAEALAFGVGREAGFGGLYDEGGDDGYSTEASAVAVRHASTDESCPDCPAPGISAQANYALALGHGVGQIGGTGILLDAGGNDLYSSVATLRAEAVATDDREVAPPATEVRATARSLIGSFALGQGSGAAGGLGLIKDVSGDDVYALHSSSDARALATAVDAAVARVAEASAGASANRGQAHANAGYAELRDLGGRDVYLAESSSAASGDPQTIVSAAGASAFVQASSEGGLGSPTPGFALLLDEDFGTSDSFTSVPPDPTCLGVRGEGVWVDCGPVGLGVNR